MAFFDLKEGFCSTSWISPKRFCCTPRDRLLSSSYHNATTRFSFLSSVAFGSNLEEHHLPGEVEECPEWIGWGEWLGNESEGIWSGIDFGAAEFGAYGLIAVRAPPSSTELFEADRRLAHTRRPGIYTDHLPLFIRTPRHLEELGIHLVASDSGIVRCLARQDAAIIVGSGRESASPVYRLERCGRGEGPGRAEEGHVLCCRERDPRDQDDPVRYAPGQTEYQTRGLIRAGFVIHGYLGGWTLLTKSVGLALSVASGLSLGPSLADRYTQES
jgi:chloride channel 3/4/5